LKTNGFQTFLKGYPVAETTGNSKLNIIKAYFDSSPSIWGSTTAKNKLIIVVIIPP